MVRYGIFLLRPAGRYGIWYWRGVFLATASFQSWGASMKALLGACPSIRDHRFRREFDSVKAAIRSRIFHCGYRSEHRFENSIPWDSAICEYSDRLLDRTNFPFGDRPPRSRYSNLVRTKALPKRQSFLLETLESRLLLSAVLLGPSATWTDLGPGTNHQRRQRRSERGRHRYRRDQSAGKSVGCAGNDPSGGGTGRLSGNYRAAFRLAEHSVRRQQVQR
jgi:hypothetical protein